MTPKPKDTWHILRADPEFNEALTALIAAIAAQDGIKPNKSHAIRRAVIYTERMMRTAQKEQNDVK